MKKQTKTRADKDKALLTVDVPGGGGEETKDEEDTKDESKAGADGKETTDGKDATDGKEKTQEEAEDTVDDRVFICIGKTAELIERKTLWVMTINRTYDTITFWEAKNHKHYVLKHRIDPAESKYLKQYLSPSISAEE